MRQFNAGISVYNNIDKIKLGSVKEESGPKGLLSPMRMGNKNKEDKQADPMVRVAYHVQAIREKRQKVNGA
jgi:hypothetical protein